MPDIIIINSYTEYDSKDWLYGIDLYQGIGKKFRVDLVTSLLLLMPKDMIHRLKHLKQQMGRCYF